jgi:hypothetical protein
MCLGIGLAVRFSPLAFYGEYKWIYYTDLCNNMVERLWYMQVKGVKLITFEGPLFKPFTYCYTYTTQLGDLYFRYSLHYKTII